MKTPSAFVLIMGAFILSPFVLSSTSVAQTASQSPQMRMPDILDRTAEPRRFTPRQRVAQNTTPLPAPGAAATEPAPVPGVSTRPAPGVSPPMRRSPKTYADLKRRLQPLGQTQGAWNDAMPTDGQRNPGVVTFDWNQHKVMQLRLRAYMVTLIHLPDWEVADSIALGDPSVFKAEFHPNRKNIVQISARHPGADTNMVLSTESGRLYAFYLRSETYDSQFVPDLVAYVFSPSPEPPVILRRALEKQSKPATEEPGLKVRQKTPVNRLDRETAIMLGADPATLPPMNGQTGGVEPVQKRSLPEPVAARATDEAPLSPGQTITRPAKMSGKEEWLREIPFNVANIRWDDYILEAQDPASAQTIAPVKVFHDGVFTYLDFDYKADRMERPVVSQVVDGIDTPVNIRTTGPNGNILVVEAVGNFSLAAGNKVVCLTFNGPGFERPPENIRLRDRQTGKVFTGYDDPHDHLR